MAEIEQQGTNLLDQLNRISDLDIRRTFSSFYATFDLDNYYSSSMIHLILSGKRQPRNREFLVFLSRCISIYESFTSDYTVATPDKLQQMKAEFEEAHETEITIDTLKKYVDGNLGVLREALNRRHNQYSNDFYDLFKLNMIELQRTPNSMTNNLYMYHALENQIMRAMIADGTKLLTKMEVARIADIDVKILDHPEIACRDAKLYTEVYAKLINAQQDYKLEQK